MNSLFVIAPYKHLDMWVFDDGARGLVQEPFVGGADLLIDLATAGFESPEKGFRMVFSAGAFPGAGLRLEWRRAEMGGNVYFCESLGSGVALSGVAEVLRGSAGGDLRSGSAARRSVIRLAWLGAKTQRAGR